MVDGWQRTESAPLLLGLHTLKPLLQDRALAFYLQVQDSPFSFKIRLLLLPPTFYAGVDARNILHTELGKEPRISCPVWGGINTQALTHEVNLLCGQEELCAVCEKQFSDTAEERLQILVGLAWLWGLSYSRSWHLPRKAYGRISQGAFHVTREEEKGSWEVCGPSAIGIWSWLSPLSTTPQCGSCKMEAEVEMKCHPQMTVLGKPLHTFRRVPGTAQSPQECWHMWSVGPDQIYLSGSPQIAQLCSSQNTWEMWEYFSKINVASLQEGHSPLLPPAFPQQTADQWLILGKEELQLTQVCQAEALPCRGFSITGLCLRAEIPPKSITSSSLQLWSSTYFLSNWFLSFTLRWHHSCTGILILSIGMISPTTDTQPSRWERKPSHSTQQL